MLRATAWDELDLPRLKGLIESSFGRTLVPDYFQKTGLLRAYVSENYRTAVILTDEAEGVYRTSSPCSTTHRAKASAVRSGT